MKIRVLFPFLLTVFALAGCEKKPSAASHDAPGQTAAEIDAEDKATAANLRPAKDPIEEEMMAAMQKTRKAFNNRRFDDLEKEAAALRSGKLTYGNGAWKLHEFYRALECDDNEPENTWQLHDLFYQEWITAKPASITARVAYAEFLTNYAWKARGSGYAKSVTKDGWRVFEERLAAARKVLEEARSLDEKDPHWWIPALTVALGQDWKRADHDALVAEAHAFEPTYWNYDTARAYSLLPRWQGEPGDWEAFAEQTAARPGGPGMELYARILFYLGGYYDNVFQETKASWPKTKEGLTVLLQKHPDSLDILSRAALLASQADDRTAAQEWFAKIGDRYLPMVWDSPEDFVQNRRWAATGIRVATSNKGASRQSGNSGENIDADEKAIAAKLQPAKDPVLEEIGKANLETSQAYNDRRFDDLEEKASKLRAGKEMFGNGSWKIAQFYVSLRCGKKEPESVWQLHDTIHKEWIAAKPASITARVAYADFLTEYAWHARGTGYANTVTEEGARLLGERLTAAGKVLQEARALEEKDPCWWLKALRVSLGLGLERTAYDALVDEAHAFEPTFFEYDNSRAYSLLPRWHGQPGDWEAFAEKTAARPDGLGVESYARIVMQLRGFHENVFRESRASWPKTKEGLTVLIKKYPDSLEILSEAALLATMAQDREAAQRWYGLIGDRYLPSVFRTPQSFVHYRHWAQTGQW